MRFFVSEILGPTTRRCPALLQSVESVLMQCGLWTMRLLWTKVLRSLDCGCAFFTPPVSHDSAQRSKLQEGRRGDWIRGKWECLLFSCRLWIVESWNMRFLTIFGSHAPRAHQDCRLCNLGICDLREANKFSTLCCADSKIPIFQSAI